MKPYIMNYATKSKVLPNNFDYDHNIQMNIFKNGDIVILKKLFGPTGCTESLEPTDPDELETIGTVITKTIEPVDPDEFLFGATLETRSTEPNDPDEVIF